MIGTGLRTALSTRLTEVTSNEHQLKLTAFSKNEVKINTALEISCTSNN